MDGNGGKGGLKNFMLKKTTLIDVPICANRLIGVSGLIFAVVDDNVTVEEAIANKGQTVSYGNRV